MPTSVFSGILMMRRDLKNLIMIMIKILPINHLYVNNTVDKIIEINFEILTQQMHLLER